MCLGGLKYVLNCMSLVFFRWYVILKFISMLGLLFLRMVMLMEWMWGLYFRSVVFICCLSMWVDVGSVL